MTIVYPQEWAKIGLPIPLTKIEETIIEILRDIDCSNVSFSGGIDSALLVYFMRKAGKRPTVYTIGISDSHPDVLASREMSIFLPIEKHWLYIPTAEEIEVESKPTDFAGDNAVRLLYKKLKSMGVTDIIAGDGIDEFMCGYYAHQRDPNYTTYHDYIQKLQDEQLRPLNNNSMDIRVHLPYLDERLITLLSQIPVDNKVNHDDRKLLMQQMAKRAGLPETNIKRRKYGFCDALIIK